MEIRSLCLSTCIKGLCSFSLFFLLFVRYYFCAIGSKFANQYRTQGNVLFSFGIMWQYLAYVGTTWIESNPQNTLNFSHKALTDLKSFVRIKENIQNTLSLVLRVFCTLSFDWNWLKRIKKRVDKVDSYHSLTKDYGIMAGANGGFSRVCCVPLPPSGLIPFPLVFPPVPLC